MNETKIENFTPGKWRVSNKDFNDPTSISAGLGAISIISDLPDGGDLFVAEAFGDVFEGNPTDNAKLIAMAPTLYAENQRLKEVNAELVDFIRRLHDELEVEHITHTEQLHLTKRIGELIQKATQP